MNDILEIEFQLGYALGIPPIFNDWEFFELIWKFERMAEQRKKENEESQLRQSGRRFLSYPFREMSNEMV